MTIHFKLGAVAIGAIVSFAATKFTPEGVQKATNAVFQKIQPLLEAVAERVAASCALFIEATTEVCKEAAQVTITALSNTKYEK